jgi:hypothetical protein
MARTKMILGVEVPNSMHSLYHRMHINVRTDAPVDRYDPYL